MILITWTRDAESQFETTKMMNGTGTAAYGCEMATVMGLKWNFQSGNKPAQLKVYPCSRARVNSDGLGSQSYAQKAPLLVKEKYIAVQAVYVK